MVVKFQSRGIRVPYGGYPVSQASDPSCSNTIERGDKALGHAPGLINLRDLDDTYSTLLYPIPGNS